MVIKVCFVLNFQYSTFAVNFNEKLIEMDLKQLDIEAILRL